MQTISNTSNSSRFLASVMAEGEKPMEVDSSDGSNCNAQSSKEKVLVATPVPGGSSGEGLPYAPEGWPCPGDVWTWKVGKRKTHSGYWRDRILFPPSRLQRATSSSKPGFYSKVLLEQYIQKEFPEVDFGAFFASFIWRVPCPESTPEEDAERSSVTYRSRRNIYSNGGSKSEPAVRPGDCKSGNKMCSLRATERNHPVAAKTCDICCTEIGFCRDCSCILCCKTVDWEYGGYSSIRCEARVDENYICGHVAHLDCALRAYMAGTIGGSIGLDAEYYCRRCDNKTDLILHVSRLIKTSESLDSPHDIEKILSFGLCILRGSEQVRAKDLQNYIATLMAKLKRGVNLGDIFKEEDNNTSTLTACWESNIDSRRFGIQVKDVSCVMCLGVKSRDHVFFKCPPGDVPLFGSEVTVLGAVDTTKSNRASDFMNAVEPSEMEAINGRAQRPVYITSDHSNSNASVKIDDEVDGVLQKLKDSQESEYRLAEQKLYAQKDLLLSLYQQLEAERSELASDHVLNRVDQIKHEEAKLHKMMKIANGFGGIPKTILSECFGLTISD
ncbi:uncharacterized protein M6B38_280430 [Iris pallida]|uniref:Oberon PHD finger domain-containing protein n=1 Tax=Iris pallida TaxID=29817 RepID=A0AAX6I1M2_IRIPA|nr:uncharacterized protein M6B38_280430 [Iris pallida]